MADRIKQRKRHQAVDVLTYEIALLYFRMSIAAREHVGQGRHSAGRRSILRSLGNDGPQTVPSMARLRAVSRQHVQKLVNELKVDGMVRSGPHPQDGRTRLIHLTAEGRRFLANMEAREAVLFDWMAEGIPLEDLHAATKVVRLFRARLESDEWEDLLLRV
jgi:DNA-binding MarR family transcriptional regulator